MSKIGTGLELLKEVLYSMEKAATGDASLSDESLLDFSTEGTVKYYKRMFLSKGISSGLTLELLITFLDLSVKILNVM